MGEWVPALIVVVVVAMLIAMVRLALRRRGRLQDSHTLAFRTQAWTVALVLVGLFALIFALPDGIDRNLALSATGLVVTGALAISSQSIIANGMAGIMLRIIRNFRPGDFIEVADQTGRVSEMGLFHTEIQSPDRDLITLPNALMVNEPVRVMRSSGTIVSVQIGLGYDLSRHRLKELFIVAAEASGLTDPFVQVVELGDYAVTYRVAGFLADPTKILATRSRLRESLLDTLSEAGIEIMSPMYVARRSVSTEPLLPESVRPKASVENRRTAEDLVFDKAELAGTAEELRGDIADVNADLERLRARAGELEGSERAAVLSRIEAREARLEQMTQQIGHLAERTEIEE